MGRKATGLNPRKGYGSRVAGRIQHLPMQYLHGSLQNGGAVMFSKRLFAKPRSSPSSFPFSGLKFLLPLTLTTLLTIFSIIISPLNAFPAQISLAWDANTEADLSGYKVYYGTTSETYGTPIDAGNVTTYTLTGLASGQTYYVAVTAYNTTNNESGYSNEVNGAATDSTQTYTVTTNPAGRQVVVDGVTYTAPQTFSWAVGSSHTLSVSSPQSETSGTRYAFSSWSDGVNQSHTVTAPSSSTTYTANFTTQYSLTTGASPSGGGAVSPSGTNWYNSGKSVSISATATPGYSFMGWSGNLSGSTNPTDLILNGVKSVTAQFTAIPETISPHSPPSGTSSGNAGTAYSYLASGASSSLGHSLEYQFDWKGDGKDLSSWGAAYQQKTWTAAGTYSVRVRARCSTHTSVVSSWSAGTSVVIKSGALIGCTDSGVQCLDRTDGGNDSDNLVNGKPKADVEYEFKITLQDTRGTPQYVRLLTTQRTNPSASDFYEYDMACSGSYTTGANCTYRTMLGPAAVHKFYFKVKMSDGTEIIYPNVGYITGPKILLLNGINLVGIPRDIASANLGDQEAFGSQRVYRWNAEQNRYTKVSTSEPVKEGEGYSLYKQSKQNKTVLELDNYGEIPGLEYTYPLHPGLNLVSNPYSGNVILADVRIQKGTSTPVSWGEAIVRGWIVDALYYYNGKDWGDTYSYMTSENGGVLVPWLGYWVNLNATDDLYNLVIPRP